MGNDVRGGKVKLLALLDHLLQIFIDLLRQALLHGCVVKYIFSKDLRNINQFAHILFSILSFPV